MLTNQRVEDIDQLLNELEREAQSNVPSSRFFAHLLQRVRLLLECDSVSILAPTGSAWLCLAQQGAADPSVADAFAKSLAGYAVDQQPESVMSSGSSRPWYAVPLRTASFAKGCLLVTFSTQPPSAAVPGMLELLSAFAEVLALRQMNELESFLDHRWGKLQALCTQLLDASPGRDSAATVVNELVSICGAARVSLAVVNRLGTVQLQRVSGTVTLDANAKVVRGLTRLAEKTASTCKPHLQQNRAASNATQGSADIQEDGVFANALCLPLVTSNNGKRCESALVIEWTDYETMISSVASVAHIMPTLSIAWQQHQRWQRVPSFLRWLGDRRAAPSRVRSRLVIMAIVAALAYVAYRGLILPYPLTVDATGVIEPKVSRTVFASLDGHLRELLVEDGQLVEANQPVARMHSPDIEFRIEEVLGELRTLKEKRNALQVASNQIDANASDAMLTQNRLAADIKQIETQATGSTSNSSCCAPKSKRQRLSLQSVVALLPKTLNNSFHRVHFVAEKHCFASSISMQAGI